MNYSIPIEYVVDSYKKILKDGQAVHGTLHMSWTHTDRDYMDNMGIPKEYNYGLFLRAYPIGYSLYNSDVNPGDTILEYDGHKIPDENDTQKFLEYISNKKPGQKVILTVFQDGYVKKYPVVVEERVKPRIKTYETPHDIVAKEISPIEKYRMGFDPLTEGLFIYNCKKKCKNGEDYYDLGLLFRVNNTPIASIDDLKTFLETTDDKSLVFYYWHFYYGAAYQEILFEYNPRQN